MKGTKGGRNPDEVRLAWTLRYELSAKAHRQLSVEKMEQLSFCKSDEARRLLLGVK